jgi:hypothetical protein
MMPSGSNLSAPRACADAGPGSANQILLPWEERLARRFILTRRIALVTEVPSGERGVVLDLGESWAPSCSDPLR